jgi:hypothetical protein
MRFNMLTKLGTIITRDKGKGGGEYNISTGVIKHPPAGSGRKMAKIKTKTKITKSEKK